MVALKLRQLIVYAATGLFFLVAAISLAGGAPLTDAFVKALVSCLVLVALGMALVRVVEDAEKKEAAGPKPAASRGGEQSAEQAG